MAEQTAKPSALIAACVYRYMEPRTLMCLEAALKTGRYALLRYFNDAQVDRARSMALSDFLRLYKTTDVMIFVDGDMMFSVDQMDRVVELAREKKSIAGGAYPVRRKHESWPACRSLEGDGALTFGPDKPPHRMLYVGTGFMAVHRSVLETLSKTLPFCTIAMDQGFWPFCRPFEIQHPNGEWEYLPDDWAFCERVYEAGHECWLDMASDIGHLGQYEYHLGDAAQSMKNPEERRLVYEDLAEYWGLTVPEMMVRLQNGGSPQEVLAEAWRECAPKTPEEVERFYREQDGYIPDLVLWNVSEQFWQDVQVPLRCRGRVADFGGGIGSLALALATRGATVFYVDLPSPQRTFAEWRFKRHENEHGKVSIHTSLTELQNMDTVVSTDTMEHLHPDTLPLYTKQMYDALRPGGQARIISRFGRHESHPMHYDCYEQYMEAMVGAGFEGGPGVWAKPA